jgi:thiol-disulfide isomerase/thioredoxin
MIGKIVGLFLLATLLGITGVGAQDIGLELNTVPAPVTIEDLDGKPVDFAQFMGKKPVILEFWATWCGLCKELEPTMVGMHKKYGSKVEFVIVAVGVNQNVRSIKRHFEGKPIPGRLLWDGQGKAVRAFMAPGTSYIVVLDAKGKVVYTGSGGDQQLDPVLARVASSAR